MLSLTLALALSVRPDFAFVKVNVVPMDREHVIYGQTVLIKDGVISKIGPYRDTPVEKDVPQIDGKGELFLLPGLADMHMHLYYTGDLLSLLANGITTTRNMRGKQIHLDWRKQVHEGTLLGPRIVTAGPILGGPRDGFVNVTTPEEGIREVEAQAKAGYDFIKVYDGVPASALRSIVKAAHAHHMKVAGHSNDEMGLAAFLKSGVDSSEHAEQFVYDYLDDDYDVTKIKGLAKMARSSGIYVCPTMGVIDNFVQLVENKDGLLGRPEIKYANPEVLEYWATVTKNSAQPNKLLYWFQAKLVKELADEGVPLLAGTDTHIVGFVPGFSLHREFEHMTRAGLSPYQVLLSATRTPGEYLGLRIGQVREGFEADLLLVRGNPLESVGALQNRGGVMASGRWYTQELLDSKMSELVASYGEPGR